MNIGFCQNKLEHALWLWLLLGLGATVGLKVGTWLFLESSQLVCAGSQVFEQRQMPDLNYFCIYHSLAL